MKPTLGLVRCAAPSGDLDKPKVGRSRDFKGASVLLLETEASLFLVVNPSRFLVKERVHFFWDSGCGRDFYGAVLWHHSRVSR